MAYTVKQVAELSGVSVRTLHFYDEVGLLKPAYQAANGYRFYDEPQLLMLQQILFYRELGFELKQIKQIVSSPNFEKISALQSHRQVLQETLVRTHRLLETIDKTIEHLKGTTTMPNKELFAGFTIAAGEDRFGEQIKLGGPGGEANDCKVSAQDTDGGMAIFEFTGRGGGPRHLHHEQDEWIYILDGEFDFQVGEQTEISRLGPGQCIFLPRKVSHAWVCVGEASGRIINVYQPAGKMEAFFRELGRPFEALPTMDQMQNKSVTQDQVKALHRLFAEHGLELLGPPLGFEQST